MFFVVDRERLKGVIAIVRDDRTKAQQGADGPFLRIEALGESLKISGREAESELPATVHEPGVSFLRVTKFRLALDMIDHGIMLAIRVTENGLHLDNMRFGLVIPSRFLYQSM